MPPPDRLPTEARGVPGTVTWGLLAVFALHDLEELVTMPSWLSDRVSQLRQHHPDVPQAVWEVLDPGPARIAVAIALTGALVGSAAADGARTSGRSELFQTTLAGFGLHSLTHLGQTVARRGYTPGVLTAPTLVAPYAWWAWRRLGQAGARTERPGVTVRAVAGVPLAILGAHAGALAAVALARRVGSRVRRP